jgi:hypothetical protein
MMQTIFEELLESNEHVKSVNNRSLLLMQEGAINFAQLHNMITRDEYNKLMRMLEDVND